MYFAVGSFSIILKSLVNVCHQLMFRDSFMQSIKMNLWYNGFKKFLVKLFVSYVMTLILMTTWFTFFLLSKCYQEAVTTTLLDMNVMLCFLPLSQKEVDKVNQKDSDLFRSVCFRKLIRISSMRQSIHVRQTGRDLIVVQILHIC